MESLMKYIGRLNRLSILYRSEKLSPQGLSGTAHSYILRICGHPGITQDQLARDIHVHKSNVARQLAMLEEAGFITRTHKEGDKRALQVFPTEKMLGIEPLVLSVLREWNAYLLEDFTHEEREILSAMLTRMLDKATKAVHGPGPLEEMP